MSSVYLSQSYQFSYFIQDFKRLPFLRSQPIGNGVNIKHMDIFVKRKRPMLYSIRGVNDKDVVCSVVDFQRCLLICLCNLLAETNKQRKVYMIWGNVIFFSNWIALWQNHSSYCPNSQEKVRKSVNSGISWEDL